MLCFRVRLSLLFLDERIAGGAVLRFRDPCGRAFACFSLYGSLLSRTHKRSRNA